MNLSTINWGDDSAEQDPHLLEYFVGSDALTRLQRRQKPFAIGRKGSGKSALRKKLQDYFQTQPNTYVVSIAPKFNAIRTILNEKDLADGFGEEIFFQYSWLKQIYLDCLTSVGASSGGTIMSGHRAYAREVARQRVAAPPDLVENLTSILQRIKLKAGKLGELGLAIETEIREAAEIQALEHHVKGLAEEGVNFIVLIDDLDLGWDNSIISNKLLLGLLSARACLASLSPNIYPCVFLREDVYLIIISQSGHADKYRNVEKIRWDKDKLKDLLNKRINFARRSVGEVEISDPFLSVFPEMVGTSYTDNWLVERTLSRPRELIQFSRFYTEAIEGDQPDAQILKHVESEYSNWKLADLCSEYSNQYPNLDSIFAFWRTKFFRNKYHLTRTEIDEMLLRVLAEVPLNDSWFNELVRDTNVDQLLSILYEIGFVGDFTRGGAGGSTTAYSFADPHEAVFDEVQIHPCFRKAVGTVERIRNRPGAGIEDTGAQENDEEGGWPTSNPPQ